MHFAPIAPIAYLDRYAGRSHVQLALAQWCIRDARYFEWYRARRAAGDFVILDNGCYEGEMVTPEELLRVSRELNPNVLTVPDMIDDATESQRMAAAFMERYSPAEDPTLLRVLQSSSRSPYVWSELFRYELTMNHWNWVAFPRVLGEFRVSIVEACRNTKSFSRIKTHAFGWTGSLDEIRKLSQLGVTTMDSSGPVWRGLNGYTNNEVWPDIKFRPGGFGMDFEANTSIADNNLTEVFRACSSL